MFDNTPETSRMMWFYFYFFRNFVTNQCFFVVFFDPIALPSLNDLSLAGGGVLRPLQPTTSLLPFSISCFPMSQIDTKAIFTTSAFIPATTTSTNTDITTATSTTTATDITTTSTIIITPTKAYTTITVTSTHTTSTTPTTSSVSNITSATTTTITTSAAPATATLAIRTRSFRFLR